MSGRLVFPPRQGVLKQLRANVRAAASRLGAKPGACDSLALVVAELVNHAVEHGSVYRRKDLDLAIVIGDAGDRISIEFFDPEMPVSNIRDLARALAATSGDTPALDSERGRGLFLMSIYLENLHADVAPAGGLRLQGLVKKR